MIVDVVQLRESLKKCSGIVTQRSSLPICGSVLLQSGENVLIVRATDLEKMIEITIPCTGEPLSCCVPYRIINKFVSQGTGTVSLELKDGRLVLDRSKIGTLVIGEIKHGSEFPPCPPIKTHLVWKELDAKEVCRLFSIVVVGCSKEDSRPVLTAVCCRDGEIASADGFRLYNAKSVKFDFGIGRELNETPINKPIPRLTILQAIRLFGKEAQMQVAFDGNQVYFKSGGVSLASQLVQGTYPKWEQLIPASFSSKVMFSVPLMLERLNLMSQLSGGTTRLWFEQKVGGDLFYINGKSGEMDDTDYDLNLPCKIETTEVGKIAVQYNYLLDAIKAFSVCSMELTNPSCPMKITGDIEGLTVVIMPMFVAW